MKSLALLIVLLLSSTVVSAAGIKPVIITYRKLHTLLGAQVHSLQPGKVLVAAVPDEIIGKPDFDLHILDAAIEGEQELVDFLKTVVRRQEDNMGYIFVPKHNHEVEQYTYYYYTNKRQEWVELENYKQKINMLTSIDELRYPDASYTLQDVLRDNKFYMSRYTDSDQSSVRYLEELRQELEVKEEFGTLYDELMSHNRGEKLIGNEYLAALEQLVAADSRYQQAFQKALMAIKAELAAEKLVVGLRKYELDAADFEPWQIKDAERIVRLKDNSIAARKAAIQGQVHFYAFRLPRVYLEGLINAYAEKHGLDELGKRVLTAKLFRDSEVNFNAVKFGQTSQRLLENHYQEVANHQKTRKASQPQTNASSGSSTRAAKRVNKNVVLNNNADVDLRIEQQLREIIDMAEFEKVGGDLSELLAAAKILSHAPPRSSILDSDIVANILADENIRIAQMVDGKASSETVEFLQARKPLELSENTKKLIEDRFRASVGNYQDYLDRRERASISYPRSARGPREMKPAKLPTPIDALWQRFTELARRGKESDTKVLERLSLSSAHKQLREEGILTHTHFSHIVKASDELKQSADKSKLDKLLHEFAEYTPVIAEVALMAKKLESGKEAIDKAVEYASTLSDNGINNKLENLVMIRRGLQRLDDADYISHFEDILGSEQLNKVKIEAMWRKLNELARQGKEDKKTILARLSLSSAHKQLREEGILTHTHFSHIVKASDELKQSADKSKLDKLLHEFAEYTPVIAEVALMAKKLEKGGKKLIDEAFAYAGKLSDKSGNPKLESLVMIYRGLQHLDDPDYIEYFADILGSEQLITIKIATMWRKFTELARRGKENDTKVLKRLSLISAYKQLYEKGILTHTKFSNIVNAIDELKQSADKSKLDKLLHEFAEYTPVIAEVELMAKKLESGKEAIDKAVEYASTLSDNGINNKLENLVMIYRGLQHLDDPDYIEYFKRKLTVQLNQQLEEGKLSEQMLEKILRELL